MKQRRATKIRYDAPEGPAIITPLHRQDRIISPVAGAPKAWRSLCPLEAAYDQGKLGGGNPQYTAENRYEAGLHYQKIFLASEVGGRDSTQAMNISSGHWSGNDSKSRAWNERLGIESHLGQRDKIIIQMVCGHGSFPSEAVRMVSKDYKDVVSARFREALDALVEAIETARRQPRKFNASVARD